MGETKNKNLSLKKEGKVLNIRKAPTFVFTIIKVKVMASAKWSNERGTQQVLRMAFASGMRLCPCSANFLGGNILWCF